MRGLFRNPMTLWMYWLVRKISLERRYSKGNLEVGYMAIATECEFGRFNKLYPHAVLSKVRLGDMSYVSERSRLSRTNIGKFTCIGPDVMVGPGMHPSREFASIHPAFYSPSRRAQTTLSSSTDYQEFAEVTIGNDVWIGARVLILDGVVIGDGAIIGAGAVVTKNVPPYAIVGGIPARVIRFRFDELRIRKLLDLAWWNRDLDWLRANCRLFLDVDKLIEQGSGKSMG